MTTVKDAADIDLAALVREHQANLWRYLRYLGADASEADDLVQETFLAVVRKPFEQRCERSTAAYLRTAARRQLLMSRRQQRRQLDSVQLDTAELVWSRMVDDDSRSLIDSLQQCLESINGRASQALDLFYRDGLSRESLATQLGMKPDGVKTLLRRTRDALRDCIQRKVSS